MKVYVAGSSAERGAVAEAIKRLEAAGVEVTYDWTASPGWERPMSRGELAEQARKDLRAVRDADIVWLRLSEQKSEGAHAELGHALALGRYVIVSGEISGPSRIFPLLADALVDSHEAALAEVLRLSLEQARWQVLGLKWSAQ